MTDPERESQPSEAAPISDEALEELVGAMEKATAVRLETAEIAVTDEWIDCPWCNGEGSIDAETYVNIDDAPITVQFYGIGDQFGALNDYYKLATPGRMRGLVSRLRAVEARGARMEAALRPFAEIANLVDQDTVKTNDERRTRGLLEYSEPEGTYMVPYRVSMAECRAARAALEGKS